MSRPYVFVGEEVSHFSGKLRPALRYKELHYVERHADIEDIHRRTGLRFIPILITPEDETLQDTSDILDELERRHPAPPLYPLTPVQRITDLIWELYADEFFPIVSMHYRWSFPESELHARRSFAALTGDEEVGAFLADRMKSFLPHLGVNEETVPVIEAHLADMLDALNTHFEQYRFLLGDRLALGDCSLLGPFYAHLYLDPVSARLLRDRALGVCMWIERMNRPDPGRMTGWLADDALAPTMRPALALIGRDAIPTLLDRLEALDAWADNNAKSGLELPQGVGMNRSRLLGVEFESATRTYTLYMVQRVCDAYRALAPEERDRVDAALAGTGIEALLDRDSSHRVGKREFKLVFVE
jgi:glutathione S-transferase